MLLAHSAVDSTHFVQSGALVIVEECSTVRFLDARIDFRELILSDRFAVTLLCLIS